MLVFQFSHSYNYPQGNVVFEWRPSKRYAENIQFFCMVNWHIYCDIFLNFKISQSYLENIVHHKNEPVFQKGNAVETLWT